MRTKQSTLSAPFPLGCFSVTPVWRIHTVYTWIWAPWWTELSSGCRGAHMLGESAGATWLHCCTPALLLAKWQKVLVGKNKFWKFDHSRRYSIPPRVAQNVCSLTSINWATHRQGPPKSLHLWCCPGLPLRSADIPPERFVRQGGDDNPLGESPKAL